MGISLTKVFGTKKLNKKLFGKNYSWGYFRKKIGLKNPFSSSRSVPVNSASSASSIYGSTGSIVGRY